MPSSYGTSPTPTLPCNQLRSKELLHYNAIIVKKSGFRRLRVAQLPELFYFCRLLMKQWCNIMICLVLSMAVLTASEGINIMHCMHSGKTTIMMGGNYTNGNMNDSGTRGCMGFIHVQLSPTLIAQGTALLHHDSAPLLLPATFTADPTNLAAWASPMRLVTMVKPMCHDGPPPRATLSLLHILLI